MKDIDRIGQALASIQLEASRGQTTMDVAKQAQRLITAHVNSRHLVIPGSSLKDQKRIAVALTDTPGYNDAKASVERLRYLSPLCVHYHHDENGRCRFCFGVVSSLKSVSPTEWIHAVVEMHEKAYEELQAKLEGHRTFRSKAEHAIQQLKDLDMFHDQVKHMETVITNKGPITDELERRVKWLEPLYRLAREIGN